jgi:hypothetical protein
MSKELEALDRLWSETFGDNETSSISNRSDRDLIKHALKDKNGIYISKEEVNELLIIVDKLDSEIDWSQANISWEDTYLKLINKLGGTHGN